MNRRISIRIQEGYEGPTLTELGQFINPEISTEVKWGGLKEDYVALKKLDRVNLTLVVDSVAAMERATSALGISYGFPPALQDEAKKLISSKSSGVEWRRFVAANGTSVCRGLLTKIVMEGALAGRKPSLAGLVASCWIEGINPVDLDTFMDLVHM